MPAVAGVGRGARSGTARRSSVAPKSGSRWEAGSYYPRPGSRGGMGDWWRSLRAHAIDARILRTLVLQTPNALRRSRGFPGTIPEVPARVDRPCPTGTILPPAARRAARWVCPALPRRWVAGPVFVPRQDAACHRSSVVEHSLGKGEVMGSSPIGGFGWGRAQGPDPAFVLDARHLAGPGPAGGLGRRRPENPARRERAV